MEEIVRSSDITGAMRQLKALSTLLNEATEELKRWQIAVDVQVIPDSFDLKVTVTKPGGDGFIKTVPKEDVFYYGSDVEGLIDSVIADIFDKLIRPEIRNEIGTKIARASKNVLALSGKAR